MLSKILDKFDYFKLRRKYNTLAIEYETLKEQVKNRLFKEKVEDITLLEKYNKLKEENKKLRAKLGRVCDIYEVQNYVRSK